MLQIIMIVAYLLITACVSVMMNKRAKSSTKSFYTANQGMSVIVVAALLFSEIIAGSGTIGNAANAFTGGLSNAVWANWGMSLGCILVIFTVTKFYRAMNEKLGVLTIPEAYAALFDNRVRILMMFIVALVYIIFYSSQAVAASTILGPLLGLNETHTAWLISIFFIVVAIIGGMHGAAWMSVLHSCVMCVGVTIVAFAAIGRAGGLEVLVDSTSKGTFNVIGASPMNTLANALGTAISFLASANVTNVIFGAKNLRTAKKGLVLAGIVVIPFALMPALTGIAARVCMPDIAPNGALFQMATSMGTLYSGILSMAIIAAIWSTAPTLLLVVAGTITKDFYVPFLRKNATDQEQLRFSYVIIAVVGIFGTWLGMHMGSILDNMLGAFQIRSVVGVVLIVALVWPRVTSNAAFWSMLGGGLVSAFWFFTGKPFGIAPLWPGSAVCLVILIALTLCSKAPVSPGYALYQDAVNAMEHGAQAKQ
jgi:SSS family solute:Na+ symporter